MTNEGALIETIRAGANVVASDGAVAYADPIIEDVNFRLLAENMPVLCWMADADGYIFWYNRRWHDYCGTTSETMAGWGWQSVHDPDVLPAVLEKWSACIASGIPFEMTFPLRGADGIFRPFLTRVQPYRDSAGAIKSWFGVNMDVSVRFAVEAELRTTISKFEVMAAERDAILGQVDEGVIITDPEGRITFVNDAAARLHGVAEMGVEPDGYAVAYSLLTEAGDPHPAETLPLSRAVRDRETVVDARWRVRRPDGTEILAMGNAKPVYRPDKEFIGAVLTIRDDTIRSAAEVALADAVRVKDVLLQEVNHRVKNSLQLVTSLLSLQADRTTLPEVRAGLLEARLRIGVIAGMHQRLYMTTQHDSVDLPSYLHELAGETIAALDADSHIELKFTAGELLSVSLEDAVPLALVVSELLTNAMKYAFEGCKRGTISINLLRTESEVFLTIADNGKGLPENFDPSASNGLGMLIVNALIGQVTGKLTVVTQERGSAFVITLPVNRLLDATANGSRAPVARNF